MSKEIQSRNVEGGRASAHYDLEERTALFGESVIGFAKCVPSTPVSFPLISQLVRAATSIGANHCEADDAGSKNEFGYRISICKRESRETKHWLRMIAAAAPALKDESRRLWREAKELHLIFATIHRKVTGKSDTSRRSNPK